MKKIMSAALAAVAFAISPVQAVESEELRSYNSLDSLGCMILRECTDGVIKLTTISDLQKEYPNTDYSLVADEFSQLLTELNRIGVDVFLAPDKYFPPNNRGVYDTVSNTFFLNDGRMGDAAQLISVTRHEGWHVAQDCMAGTIDNTFLAIIVDPEEVPVFWQEYTERVYSATPNVIPWEKEAIWAGKTEDMTVSALSACQAPVPMWETYEPTPMTREWLESKGYIK